MATHFNQNTLVACLQEDSVLALQKRKLLPKRCFHFSSVPENILFKKLIYRIFKGNFAITVKCLMSVALTVARLPLLA